MDAHSYDLRLPSAPPCKQQIVPRNRKDTRYAHPFSIFYLWKSIIIIAIDKFQQMSINNTYVWCISTTLSTLSNRMFFFSLLSLYRASLCTELKRNSCFYKIFLSFLVYSHQIRFFFPFFLLRIHFFSFLLYFFCAVLSQCKSGVFNVPFFVSMFFFKKKERKTENHSWSILISLTFTMVFMQCTRDQRCITIFVKFLFFFL